MAIAAAIATAACSLFVDTGGLSGGNDAATASDASSDATANSDGAIASDGGEAGPIPFCQANPGHTVCLDFDESTALPPYDNSHFDPTKFFIDGTTSVSAPQSLFAKMTAGDSHEEFDRNLPSTLGKLVWKFDIKFSSSDLTAGQIAPLSTNVPVVDGLSDHSFYMQTYDNGFFISESASPADGGATRYPSTKLASPVPLDTWMHVELTVDGATGNMKMSFNGTALPDGQAQAGFPSGTAVLAVGGYAESLPADAVVHIDNLIVDY